MAIKKWESLYNYTELLKISKVSTKIYKKVLKGLNLKKRNKVYLFTKKFKSK